MDQQIKQPTITTQNEKKVEQQIIQPTQVKVQSQPILEVQSKTIPQENTQKSTQKVQQKQPQPEVQTIKAVSQNQTKQNQQKQQVQQHKQPVQNIIKDPLSRNMPKVESSQNNIKPRQKTIQQIIAEQNAEQIIQEQQNKEKPENKIIAKEEKSQKKEENKQIEATQQIKFYKQQQIMISDLSNTIIDRPISINLGKDTIQMEKQNIITFKESDIIIQIKQRAEKGFALNKQLLYRIVGQDKHGPIDIFRSLQQFQSLRRILLERWPGIFVPSISVQSDAKTQKLRNLHRYKNLEEFIRKISYVEQIYYKQQVQLFLRSYGINMEEMFAQMPILRTRDVIQRYKGCFGQIVQKQNQAKNSSMIAKFSASLKKIVNHLNNISKKVLKLAESYQIYQESMPKFANFLSHYQNSCLSQYTNDPNNTIALRDKQQKINKFKIIKQKDNIFYDLYLLLQNQSHDASSLNDVIIAMQMFVIRKEQLESQNKQIRQQIEQIALGHKNIKLITSRKPRQQVQAELQQKQRRIINEKEIVIQLSNMAEVVMANMTIPLFKKIKINNYFQIIKKWVQNVGQINMELYEVWKFLSEESNEQSKKSLK